MEASAGLQPKQAAGSPGPVGLPGSEVSLLQSGGCAPLSGSFVKATVC